MADPFGRFGSFNGFGALRSNFFGARDPFHDPFFSRPFEDLLEPHPCSSEISSSNGGKGLRIEELLPEEEESDEGKETVDEKHSESVKHATVEHPDDDDEYEGEIQKVKQRGDFNRVESTESRAHAFKYHTCKVTYGGVDGAYYTSTRTRRADSDGVVIEESKEADKSTGEASHRISRGIHDKGHSVTRKLASDGRVDTTQTLHNLNEDELGPFEEAWKGGARSRLPSWTGGLDIHDTKDSNQERERKWGGWLLPSEERPSHRTQEKRAHGPKKVVRINID